MFPKGLLSRELVLKWKAKLRVSLKSPNSTTTQAAKEPSIIRTAKLLKSYSLVLHTSTWMPIDLNTMINSFQRKQMRLTD